jgi:hypothetical protein
LRKGPEGNKAEKEKKNFFHQECRICPVLLWPQDKHILIHPKSTLCPQEEGWIRSLFLTFREPSGAFAELRV